MSKTEVTSISYGQALYKCMRQALREGPETIIIGQGVNDHKGTFGSTLGLAEEFGRHRVLDTPLSEAGVAGIAIGAALNGLYPIQTHIRVDFVLLAMNQLVNLAAKYRYMFGGRFELPMLIRLVIGRSWGQGAQHSQSLQSLFAHIPGLTVLMPSSAQSIMRTYPHVIRHYRNPVISLEHRLMYDLQFLDDPATEWGHDPLASVRIRHGKDVTIVATSIMVLEAKRAAEYLASVSDIDCDIIDLNCVSHPSKELIIDSVKRTGRLLVADTSWPAFGTCAEICRIVCESVPSALKAPVITLGMRPSPCPTAKSLEDLYYPSLATMTDSIVRLVKGDLDHSIPLPGETSMADVYKRFKGPF